MRQSLLFFCLLISSFVVGQSASKTDSLLLEQLMQSQPTFFDTILKNRDDLRVQIMYTQIDRNRKNKPSFKDYSFNLDKNLYYYPASTVKMPLAFLALEKLNDLNLDGVDLNTTIITDSIDEQKYLNVPQSDDMKDRPTIARFIKQIFLVSDNDAFNRLYEFLGQEAIQRKLTEKGYPDAAIRHRLSVSRTEEQNRRTPIIYFLDKNGKKIHTQAAQVSKAIFPFFQTRIGKGYYAGSTLVNEPFSFDEKNRVYLQDFHQMIQSVMMPKAFPASRRFNLTQQDYTFLHTWMSAFPSESSSPKYDSSKIGDVSAKFLFYGAEKVAAPKHIRIFNKIGGAYGFLTDVIYFTDQEKKIEFFLSTTILCNGDGIFNDDKYDYNQLGYPFLKQLGQLVYAHELQRKKKRLPDLKRYQLTY